MKRKYYPYIDVIRIFAIIGVIVIHVSVPFLNDSPVNSYNWWIGLIYTTLFKASVPLFFMISGALLLSSSSSDNISHFLKSRFLKIVIPFLIANCIYAFLTSISDHTNYLLVLKKSLSGSIFYHLWFMYILIGLYLLTPILKIFVQNSPKQHLQYFLILWGVITLLNPIIKEYLGINLNVFLSNMHGYVGYFVLGYYLNKFPLTLISRNVFSLSSFSIILIIIYTTYLRSTSQSETDTLFLEYLSITIALYSICIYSLIQNITISDRNKLRLNSLNLSRLVFNIYLIHPLIIYLLSTYVLGLIKYSQPQLYIALATILTSIIAYIFALVLSRLKISRI